MLSSILYPALGTGFIFLMSVLGAAVVFFFSGEIKPGIQSALLGFAAGVMLAASVWSLLIPATERAVLLGISPCWLPAALGIAAGVIFLSGLDSVLAKNSLCSAERSVNALLLTAITLHNIPEGMAVGLAFALATDGDGLAAAAALAFGIGIQNFPEGAAVSLPLRKCGLSRPRSFLAGVLSGAVEPVFGMLAVLAAAVADVLMPWLLSFAAGAMLYVCADELIPQAKSRGGITGFTAGFLIMMILDVALG